MRDGSLHYELTFELKIKLIFVLIFAIASQGLGSYAQDASPEDNLLDFGDLRQYNFHNVAVQCSIPIPPQLQLRPRDDP